MPARPAPPRARRRTSLYRRRRAPGRPVRPLAGARLLGWGFVGLCAAHRRGARGAGVPDGLARRQGRRARRRRRRMAWRGGCGDAPPSDRPSRWRGSIGSRSSAPTPSTPGPRSSGWCSAWCPALAAAFPRFADQLREWGDAGHPRSATWPSGPPRRGSQLVERRAGDPRLRVQHAQHRAGDVPRRQGARQPHREPAGHRDGRDGGRVQPAVARRADRHRHRSSAGSPQVWHDLGVHVLAGIAYVFALLLFPDGSIDRSRGPHLMGLALVLRPVLVLRHRRSHERPRAAVRRARPGRRPARALAPVPRGARAPSSASSTGCSAWPWGCRWPVPSRCSTVTSMLKSSDERFTETTRDYELGAPAAGTYIFYCDPHTDGHGGHGHRSSEPTSSDDGTADRAHRGPRQPVRQGPHRARGGPDRA